MMDTPKEEMHKSIRDSDAGKFVEWLTVEGYKIVFDPSGRHDVLVEARRDDNNAILIQFTKLMIQKGNKHE